MCLCFQVSDDGRFVLLSIREGCDPVNRLWYCDLNAVPQGITGTNCSICCFIIYCLRNNLPNRLVTNSFLLCFIYLIYGRLVAVGEADR